MNQDDMKKVLARIDNWVRWARSSGNPQGHCASIEHRYVEPRPDETKAEAKARDQIDVLDAELIEEAIRSIAWRPSRVVIKAFYKAKLSKTEICKSLRVGTHRFDVLHRLAIDDLAASIRFIEHRNHVAIRKSRRYNSSQMTKQVAASLPVGSVVDPAAISKAA